MKIRSGFVSNSSSSSFIVALDDISGKQAQRIHDHIEEGQLVEVYGDKEDEWEIKELADRLVGFTWMDNFNMREFMEKIGVDMSTVRWSDYDDWAEEEEITDEG